MNTIIREQLVSPEMALEILKTNIRNRPLKKDLVIFYSRQMEDGKWKYNGETVIISDDNILLDGQHRLAAVVKSKTTQKLIIVSGIDKNTFDTIDVGKTRSSGDMLNISGVKNGNQISAIISYSIKLENNITTENQGQRNIPKYYILEEYYKNPDFWQNIKQVSEKMYSKIRLMNQGTIGGYISFLILKKGHNEEKVISFFNQLIFDTNVENSTISLLRDKYLRAATGQYKLTSRYKHAILVKTWNMYLTGRELKVLSFNIEKEQIPEFL